MTFDLETLTILIFSMISAFLTLHKGHSSSSDRFHAELGHQQNPFPSRYMTHFSSIMNVQLSDFGYLLQGGAYYKRSCFARLSPKRWRGQASLKPAWIGNSSTLPLLCRTVIITSPNFAQCKSFSPFALRA